MKLILFNKPYRVLSQFTDQAGRKTLSDFISEPGVYAAGRLDYDSEGLLLLTDDGRLKNRISHPRYKLPKTYWVQVEGAVHPTALAALRGGVSIRGGMARALDAESIEPPACLWPREPPIRYRERVPDSWIRVSIDEGRNRQVRRMTAAVGLPALRLIRAAIGPWRLGDLRPGQWRSMSATRAWRMIRDFSETDT